MSALGCATAAEDEYQPVPVRVLRSIGIDKYTSRQAHPDDIGTVDTTTLLALASSLTVDPVADLMTAVADEAELVAAIDPLVPVAGEIIVRVMARIQRRAAVAAELSRRLVAAAGERHEH